MFCSTIPGYTIPTIMAGFQQNDNRKPNLNSADENKMKNILTCVFMNCMNNIKEA